MGRSFEDIFEAFIIPEPMSGCLIWLGGQSRNGYGYATYNGRQEGTHRIAWRINKGPIPYGMSVLHKCDNKLCTNCDHLFLGTHADNMRDMRIKGRDNHAKGQDHCRAKLSEEDVIAIMQDERSSTILARIYGVRHQSITSIKRRETWRHVTDRLGYETVAAQRYIRPLQPSSSGPW